MGIIIGILSAFSTASLSTFLKKLSDLNPNFLTWVRAASALPVMAVIVTIFSLWAFPPLTFWLLIIFVITPLEIILAYLGTKALHISPMSIIAPLGAFTSIFLIPVGFIFLGELPNTIGFFGVLAIFFGSFFIGWQRKEGLLSGFKNIFRDKGSLLAVVGAFIASIAISVTKITFIYASPFLAAFYKVALLAIILAPYLLMQSRKNIHLKGKQLAGLSLVSGLGVALHHIGLSLIPVVYYISVKRLSMVINVIFGKLFFKEENIRERLMGTILMLGGIILIAFG